LYSYLIRTFIVTQINKLLTLTSSMKLSMYLLLILLCSKDAGKNQENLTQYIGSNV
jgi:hypothetical protein